MERRKFIRNVSFTTALLTLDLKKTFAFFNDPSYKITMLTNEIGIFSEQGGTIGFMLSPNGIVVIDTQFPDPAKHLIAELKSKNTTGFRLLINTHHHGDHTSGNPEFKGLVHQVVAHENCVINQKNVAQSQNKLNEIYYADTTFTDTWKKKVGKEKIKTYYFGPAHTNGDIVVHFQKANIVHLGDLVFNRRFAFVDRPGGANIKSWIQVLDKVINKFSDSTTFIFGHAYNPDRVTGNKDDVRAMQNYLTKLLEFVSSQIQAGKTKEQILQATSIPGAPEWQGNGIERCLIAAFEELTTV
ncbi:MBL fold metallo-hydrolase [soil metagenome]